MGSALCPTLERQGHLVVGASRGTRLRRVTAAHRHADVVTGAGLADAFAGADAVVNLVAASPLLPPGRRRFYHDLHVLGVANVLRACRAAGIRRLVHVGALGVRTDSPAPYARTKARGERLVLDSGLEAIVLSPSILFGRDSELIRFLDRFAGLPVVPVPRLNAPFAPLHVDDLATTIVRVLAARPSSPPERLEVVGPQTVTGTDFARLYLQAAGCRTFPIPEAPTRLALEVGWRLRPPGIPYQLAPMLRLSNVATGRAQAIVTGLSYGSWCAR